MLNKSKGNMYSFISHTWNTVKGKCFHDCAYCYMKRFGSQKPIRFDQSELKTNLEKNNFIFVGSSCDMWAWDIPDLWIEKTLAHCSKYDGNKYLFQSKNPERFRKFYGQFTGKEVFGTTIESNREYPEIYQNAPPIIHRYCSIADICREDGCEVMVTIEPILDFDVGELVGMIQDIEPAWVNIGADSRRLKMPEPTPEKVSSLIEKLRSFTEVKAKKNLDRILPHHAQPIRNN